MECKWQSRLGTADLQCRDCVLCDLQSMARQNANLSIGEKRISIRGGHVDPEVHNHCMPYTCERITVQSEMNTDMAPHGRSRRGWY